MFTTVHRVYASRLDLNVPGALKLEQSKLWRRRMLTAATRASSQEAVLSSPPPPASVEGVIISESTPMRECVRVVAPSDDQVATEESPACVQDSVIPS
jgi:hypothetical protein